MGRLVEAKNKQILHDQIWDLFPSFCDLPVDLASVYSPLSPLFLSLSFPLFSPFHLIHYLFFFPHQTFRAIAKNLGTLLNEAPALRKVLYSGLQKLIDKNWDVSTDPEPNKELRVTPDMAKAGLKSIALFAKGFLPIFFNIYEQLGSTDNKDSLFKLIVSYLKITDPNVCFLFLAFSLPSLPSILFNVQRISSSKMRFVCS
jgi:ribosomal RNA-processing protein 12